MAKKLNEKRAFMKRFNATRELMRSVILYGCFKKSDYAGDVFNMLETVGKSSYHEKMGRIDNYVRNFVLDAGKAAKIDYDMYAGLDAELINIFRSKTFEINNILWTILLLQLLHEADQTRDGESVTLNDISGMMVDLYEEILDEGAQYTPDNFFMSHLMDGNNMRSVEEIKAYFRKELVAMEKAGYVDQWKEKNRLVEENTHGAEDDRDQERERIMVHIKKDILQQIDENGYLENLYLLLMNLSKSESFSTPYYFAAKKLELYMRVNNGDDMVPDAGWLEAQRHNFIYSVLDDEITHQLLMAIKKQVSVELACISIENEYGNMVFRFDDPKVLVVTPIRITCDIETGRQYVLFFNHAENRIDNRRLEHILEVKPLKKSPYFKEALKLAEDLAYSWSSSPFRAKERHEVNIRFDFSSIENENMRRGLVNRLLNERKHGTVEALADGIYRFTIVLTDPTEIRPWLRSFTGYYQVEKATPETQMLADAMQEDLKKMGENYGII